MCFSSGGATVEVTCRLCSTQERLSGVGFQWMKMWLTLFFWVPKESVGCPWNNYRNHWDFSVEKNDPKFIKSNKGTLFHSFSLPASLTEQTSWIRLDFKTRLKIDSVKNTNKTIAYPHNTGRGPQLIFRFNPSRQCWFRGRKSIVRTGF